MSTAKPGGVAWIGTGRMGSAMVRRLLGAAIPVTVWNRTAPRAQDLVGAGAVVVTELAEAAAHALVFTSVSSSPDLLEVAQRIIGAAAVPDVLVDTSTVSTAATRSVRERCAARGIRFLSAPVSGNPSAVAAGNAAFVCSGSADAFKRVLPLLLHIGKGARYVGAADEAALLKLCHNLLLATMTEGLAEIIVLCERLGLSRTVLMEFINESALGSAFTSYKTPAIAGLETTPATFTTRLLLKDLDLGLDEAASHDVPLPLGSLIRSITRSAVERGYGDDDFLALLCAHAEAAGVTLSRPAPTEGTP